jgi:hypothetical protein
MNMSSAPRGVSAGRRRQRRRLEGGFYNPGRRQRIARLSWRELVRV